MTLIDLLLRAAEHHPRRGYTYLLDGEREELRVEHAALIPEAQALAAELMARGLSDERVLLMFPPGFAFVPAFFACLCARAVAVPVFPPDPTRLTRSLPRLRAIVRDAKASAVLTTRAVVGLAEQLKALAPELASLQWIASDAVDLGLASTWKRPRVDGETVAFLQYTSGSTAAARGVIVSHANVLYNERLVQVGSRHGPDATTVGWQPLFHDMGLVGTVLQPLYSGAECVILSPLDFLQRPARWLQAITRYRGDTSIAPNFAYDLCTRKVSEAELEGLDLRSWRVAGNGAEPVRAETLERFAERFARCGFKPEAVYASYGLAEATLVVTMAADPRRLPVSAAALQRGRVEEPAGAADRRVLVSCGRSWMDDTHVVIVGDDGARLPEGRVGEIWVQGPSVARGYFGDPSATPFAARTADGAGPFLRTGDLGFMQDGDLYVTGRLKDVIIIRGRNFYPHDLELTAERSHAAIRPGCVAVFAYAVDEVEQLAVVLEVATDGERAQEIMSAVRRAIAAEHEVAPSAVVLVAKGTIPKTSSGKLQRHVCRSAFAAGQLEVVAERRWVGIGAVSVDGARPSGAPELEEWLVKRVAFLLEVPTAQVSVDEPLTSLGMDSIALAALASELEQLLGVRLPPTLVSEHPTIRALAAHLGGRR